MSLIASRLPQPTNVVHDRPDDEKPNELDQLMSQAKEFKEPPKYGRRVGFMPRSVEDFGNGGAFPEIHVAQYPLNMGRKKKVATGTTVPVQVGKDGKIRHDLVLRAGHTADKVIHSTADAAKAKDIVSVEEDPTLQLPDEDAIERAKIETQNAIDKLVRGKLAASQPKSAAAPQEIKSQVVRYKPASQNDNDNSGAKDRILRIVDAVKDPLELAKFKHVKVPRGPGSPPPPVMHSPPRKVTQEEQQAMRIPPCISSWKNPKGWTVPIDKRLAASGQGLTDNTINDKFAKFAGALQVADRTMRETIQLQNEIQKRVAQKEKEAQEAKMRRDAQQARDERAGFRQQDDDGEGAEDERGDDLADRDAIRDERRREREREMRLQRAGGDKKNQLRRERERDISEKIALGMKMGGGKSDAQFDTRLYNNTQGMGSGFGADDGYDVYDKPLFRRKDEQGIYKPSQANEFDDAEKLKKGLGKFTADKSFAGGADASSSGVGGRRDGPVQFEKPDDVFGLDSILDEGGASGSKRANDDQDDRSSKRRR